MTRGSRSGTTLAQLTWPLAVLIMLLLVGCQSSGGARPPEQGWQVLERSGDVRASARSSGRWITLAAGDVVAPSSIIVTGAAGRVILGRHDDRVRLGPSSRLAFPATGSGIEHDMGVVHYRVADQSGRAVRIRTPHGEAEARGGLFQIDVGPSLEWTAFEVSEGAVRIATLDGTRGVTIRAGQRAEASDTDGARLAYTRVAGGPLEPAAPLAARLVADDRPPAAPASERAVLAAAPPERHPAGRSVLTARPPAPLKVHRVSEEEQEERRPPEQRIILPATFGAEETSGPKAPAVPAEGAPPSEPRADDLRALTDNLLDGLDRPLAAQP